MFVEIDFALLGCALTKIGYRRDCGCIDPLPLGVLLVMVVECEADWCSDVLRLE